MDKIIHRITESEIFYGIVSIGTHEKNEFYSKLPEKFTVKIKGKIKDKRTLGKRKISVGKGLMIQFKPFDTVTITIENDVLVIE